MIFSTFKSNKKEIIKLELSKQILHKKKIPKTKKSNMIRNKKIITKNLSINCCKRYLVNSSNPKKIILMRIYQNYLAEFRELILTYLKKCVKTGKKNWINYKKNSLLSYSWISFKISHLFYKKIGSIKRDKSFRNYKQVLVGNPCL